MKALILLLTLTLLITNLSVAQKLYKFYSKQDSIDYNHYRMIISKGYEFIVEDGKIKRELVDSSYQDTEQFISYDSARALMKKIPNFQYFVRHQNEKFTKHEALSKTNRFDTITHISFTGRELKRLPVFKLLRCKNLNAIELVNTSIKKIPRLLNWSIFGLDSLKIIRVFNHAPEKQLKFTKNKTIEELVYRDSPYSPIPKNFHRLENLKDIDFARNDFREHTKFHLQKLQNLEHLNLSRNNIDLSNLAEDTVNNLENIILSFNNLRAVPSEIGLLKDLIDLQFAENDIKSDLIHPALGSLENLKMLSFYKNDLDSLPPFIFNLKNLEELDLYYNKIEVLPEELGNLKDLKRLYVAHNRFFSVPESIGNLKLLEEFYLHHNRISYLPKSLDQLNQITDFHIHNNYFQGFPKFILSYKKLEDLDISHNDIHTFPKELVQLDNLKYLWMRGITFEASTKEEAEELKNTLETLQKNGVKVSVEQNSKMIP